MNNVGTMYCTHACYGKYSVSTGAIRAKASKIRACAMRMCTRIDMYIVKYKLSKQFFAVRVHLP